MSAPSVPVVLSINELQRRLAYATFINDVVPLDENRYIRRTCPRILLLCENKCAVKRFQSTTYLGSVLQLIDHLKGERREQPAVS